MPDVEIVSEVVDNLEAPSSWFHAVSELRDRLELPPLLLDNGDRNESLNRVRLAVSWALAYNVKVIGGGDGPVRLVVEPHMRSAQGQSTPPEVPDVQQDVVDLWTELASRVHAPFIRARLRTLLFARGGAERYKNGLEAIAAYLESADVWEDGLDSADDLERALRLARALGQRELVQQICTRMIIRAREVIASEEWKPGLALRFVEPTLGEAGAEQAENDAILTEVLQRYNEDDDIADNVLTLQIARASSAEDRAALYEVRVNRWLAAADRGTGVLRAAWRKRALEIAEESGNTELRARAAAQLQKTRKEDLGLVRLTAYTQVEREQVQSALASIRQAETWQQALEAFAIWGPISGCTDENLERVRESARMAPLQAILPVEKLGGDGLPRFRATSDVEREAYQLAKWEQEFIEAWCPWVADAVRHIAEVHGVPDLGELTNFISRRGWLDEDDAASIARSFHRFWVGDSEGCAYTVASKIEAVARQLLLHLDVGIYRLQRQQVPGQYPGLGSLLEGLRKQGLPEDWYRFIRTVCAAPEGMNLRNELAHGFLPDISSAGAVILLQSALFLSQLEANPAVDGADGGPAADAEHPAGGSEE